MIKVGGVGGGDVYAAVLRMVRMVIEGQDWVLAIENGLSIRTASRPWSTEGKQKLGLRFRHERKDGESGCIVARI